MNIQWYPGHMTKTRRQMEADLKHVDIVVEIIDARIPIASRNPDIDQLMAGKPRLIVLNREDQADPVQNKIWAAHFRRQGHVVLETDAKTGTGIKQFSNTIQIALKDQIAKWREKGQVGRPVRAMIVGVPNVGKSTFINKVAHKKSAKAGDRPGVTRGKQWVNVDRSLDLLDTPGILWPKFEDERTGLYLAFTGAVKDDIIDIETLGFHFIAILAQRYRETIETRYKMEFDPTLEGWQLLEQTAKKRGFLMAGGTYDIERMARILLDEYRGGKLGRFTLETVQDLSE